MRKYKFRFRGVTRVRGGEKIIFFFLDEPQILVGKDKKHLDAMDTSDSTVKYIPYKESECGEAAGLTAGIAYPENWQEQVGVSYEISRYSQPWYKSSEPFYRSNPYTRRA